MYKYTKIKQWTTSERVYNITSPLPQHIFIDQHVYHISLIIELWYTMNLKTFSLSQYTPKIKDLHSTTETNNLLTILVNHIKSIKCN